MGDGVTMLAGRYRLHERIGTGGMGEVWRATDELLGRTVAVKLILPALVEEPGFVRRFLAEARAMASVQHPGVVAIHDFHGDGGGAYLVMEYIQGEPLSRVLARTGRLGAAQTMDLVRQAAQALQAVHDRGIVHRDVKPANLLLRPDGTLALADFGIAVGGGGTALTGSGAIIGTPSYLAPEQVMGQTASPRSDVYALGVVAYECLAGRRPFVGDNPFAVAMSRVGQPPPPLDPTVPGPVAGVVGRALAPDPAHRWNSAAEFARAAQRAMAGGPIAGPPRPRRAFTVAALSLAVVAAAVAGLILWRGAGPASSSGNGTADSARPSATTTDGTTPDATTDATTPGATTGGPAPAGYARCGDALCPTAPMCWRGLVQNGDVGQPPAPERCTEPHYWESFAAIRLPADASSDRDLTHLMERPDIAALCSARTMAARSRDPAATREWRREAWPVAADPYTVLVHCLAGSPEGETPGAVFTAGR